MNERMENWFKRTIVLERDMIVDSIPGGVSLAVRMNDGIMVSE